MVHILLFVMRLGDRDCFVSFTSAGSSLASCGLRVYARYRVSFSTNGLYLASGVPATPNPAKTLLHKSLQQSLICRTHGGSCKLRLAKLPSSQHAKSAGVATLPDAGENEDRVRILIFIPREKFEIARSRYVVGTAPGGGNDRKRPVDEEPGACLAPLWGDRRLRSFWLTSVS